MDFTDFIFHKVV